MAIDKPTKPTDLMPRTFGGEKNNFSDDLIANGYEVNVPQTYNGDNLNYQLDATGKELDYCEKVVDYINGLGVGKTPIVNANNKLDETQVGVKVYNATETFGLGEWVKGTVDDVVGLYESLKPVNVGNELTDTTSWKKVNLGDEGANVDLSNLSTTGQAKFDEKVDLNLANSTPTHDFATKLNNAQIRTIITTYQNGTSGYIIWSNGYCEQWGVIAGIAQTDVRVEFLKQYKEIPNIMTTACNTYAFQDGVISHYWHVDMHSATINRASNTGFYLNASLKSTGENDYVGSTYWRAYGYLTEGEY